MSAGQVRLRHIVRGLVNPLGITNAGDGSNRLFVIEKRGTVRVVKNNKLQSGFFLDIRGVAGGLTTVGERGLLGLAFHPDFETNRKLFAYYTDGGGDIVIAEFTANSTKTKVSASTKDQLLKIEHSARTNHNGGQLLFGPDNRLYAFTGDGGGAGDPDENAQSRDSLLGKTLRIAPDLSGGYASPSGNPYKGAVAGRDEIWSIGLRNPWRASFDRATGSLWIADVGQGSREEINREPAGAGGRNYGWDCREGTQPYETAGCSGQSFTEPVAQYGHTGGNCSVTGGYVYRGDVFLDLRGQYVLGDFCSGKLWTLRAAASSPSLKLHGDHSIMISSFGEAENGEMFVVDYAGGRLFRVIAPQFTDIDQSRFLDDIVWLGHEGITTGCGGGKYCPKEVVTRAQMATFLRRAFALPQASTDYFDDDDSSPHEASINRIAEAEITSGCAVRKFCPDQGVNRGAMATFLSRALDLPAAGKDYFTDDDDSIHEDAINRLAAAKITQGCGGTLYCPRSKVTREQMAAFLHRALGE